ncbi:hypothetical protein CEY11_08560 [Candidimonas nitroreducens]|uniref:Uncharacterized protein n=1 Tax=Candidimonas nitroreducens TaxID=683354 RepID=A0A225MKV6_9BURK|nr:hypothetical protein CEY11_08560 [Candidimonas nitroreducens]
MKAAEAERAAALRDNDRMQAFMGSLVPLSTEALYALSVECVEQAEQLWDTWSHDERCCRVQEYWLIYGQAFKRWLAGEFGPIDLWGEVPGKRFEFGDLPAGGTKLGQALRRGKEYALRSILASGDELLNLRARREQGGAAPRITPDWSQDDDGDTGAD